MVTLDKIALNTSSLAFTLGYKKNKKFKNKKPISIIKLLDKVKNSNLGGVEFPYFRFYKDLKNIKKIKNKLVSKNLFVILDSDEPISVQQILKLIPVAKKLKTNFIRIKASNILASERWKKKLDWKNYINFVILKLNSIKEVLKKHKLKIAIENHQDFDSYELKHIIKKVGKDVIGINFDIGNSFATCENPMQFAKNLSPYILNVHIKDYKVLKCSNGFILKRCPIGSGNVDFKKVLFFLGKNSPKAKYAIELGSLDDRKILCNKKYFWKHFIYDKKQKKDYIKKLLDKNQKISKNIENPWKKSISAKSIVNYEKEELKQSINFLKKIL